MSLKSYPSRRTLLSLVVLATALCALYGQEATSKKNYKSADEASVLVDSIKSKGPASVVKDLTTGDGSRWKNVLNHIETGSPAWLDVAGRLLTATDASWTSDLLFALAIALTRNAEGVLSMVGPNLPLDKVCSVPYIEPDERTVQNYRRKVRSALQKVTSPELDSRKRDCLKAVEQ
jgi:hypothetical protein